MSAAVGARPGVDAGAGAGVTVHPVLTAARLHLVTWRAALGWPWVVMAASFAINWLIRFTMSPQTREVAWTGGLASIYVIVAIWAYGSISQLFAFSLGFGVTRRDFAAGLALVVAALSVSFGLALAGLRAVEVRTGGFGNGLEFFGPPGVAQDDGVTQALLYIALFGLVCAVMVAVAVVHHRWRGSGVFVLLIVVMLVAGGAVALLTWQSAWPAVADAIAWLPGGSAPVLLPTAVALLAAAGAWAGLRRATV